MVCVLSSRVQQVWAAGWPALEKPAAGQTASLRSAPEPDSRGPVSDSHPQLYPAAAGAHSDVGLLITCLTCIRPVYLFGWVVANLSDLFVWLGCNNLSYMYLCQTWLFVWLSWYNLFVWLGCSNLSYLSDLFVWLGCSNQPYQTCLFVWLGCCNLSLTCVRPVCLAVVTCLTCVRPDYLAITHLILPAVRPVCLSVCLAGGCINLSDEKVHSGYTEGTPTS